MRFINRISKRGPLLLLPFELILSALRSARGFATRLRCRLYGIQLESHTHLGPGIRFVYPWNIEIKEGCTIGQGVRFWSEMENSKLIIERNAEIGRECVIDFTGGLTIAEDALISEGTLVYTHDHAYDPRSIPVGQPLEIGNNAWIGARAIILPSVRFIGQRCVVGAGAVVSKDVPNDTIYVGPSGRIIRKKKKNNK